MSALAFDLAAMYGLTWPQALAVRDRKAEIQGNTRDGCYYAEVP